MNAMTRLLLQWDSWEEEALSQFEADQAKVEQRNKELLATIKSK